MALAHMGWLGCLGPSVQGPSPPSPPQQSKMEDHLDEAIHVLRSHAVGTAGDVHGLLPGHGALASGFAGPVMPLSGRHAGLVSAGWSGQAGWQAAGVGHTDEPPPCPQVGAGHSEDGLSGSSGLMHNHVALPDLSRPPDSYGGKSQRHSPGRVAWPLSVTLPQSHVITL